MLRALARIRRLDGLRARSLSTSVAVVVKPSDPDTASASQSGAQTRDDATPPGSRPASDCRATRQTAAAGPIDSAGHEWPVVDQTRGRLPWKHTSASAAGDASWPDKDEHNSADQDPSMSAEANAQPRHRRARSRGPRAAGPGDAAAHRRSKVKLQQDNGSATEPTPEHTQPRRQPSRAQHPAAAGRPPATLSAQDQSRPGPETAAPAEAPVQRPAKPAPHVDPRKPGKRPVQDPDPEKALLRTELRNLAERMRVRCFGLVWHCFRPPLTPLPAAPAMPRQTVPILRMLTSEQWFGRLRAGPCQSQGPCRRSRSARKDPARALPGARRPPRRLVLHQQDPHPRPDARLPVLRAAVRGSSEPQSGRRCLVLQSHDFRMWSGAVIHCLNPEIRGALHRKQAQPALAASSHVAPAQNHLKAAVFVQLSSHQ